MTPGPNKILKIPGSGNRVKISTINSGNTFGARFWTDGKMEAPMLPDNPWLRRHPDTGETFWCDECEEIASEELWGDSDYGDVPFAEDVDAGDLQLELDSAELTPVRERYLRTRLWWAWNDPARNGNDSAGRPEGFDTNLRKLIGLLEKEPDEDAKLMAAEALREIGEHQQATEILNGSFSEEFQWAVRVVRSANDKRDILLHEIDLEGSDD